MFVPYGNIKRAAICVSLLMLTQCVKYGILFNIIHASRNINPDPLQKKEENYDTKFGLHSCL